MRGPRVRPACAGGDRDPLGHHVTNTVLTENADGTVGTVTYEDTVVDEGQGRRTGPRPALARRSPLNDRHSELRRIPPGADGLLVLPTMTGSRFPRWRPADRGGVMGQRPEHCAAHLLRAAQEGAAFTVREGVDLLDAAGHGSRPLPVVLAGGTARSLTTAQLRADVLHRTTLVCSDPDVTLLGAAALALVGSGLAHDLDDARARIACEFRQLDPDPERAQRYDALFADWRSARETVERIGSHRPGGCAPPR